MRECGMLLPIASLPSRYGIGAFSKEAYEFVDTLKAAGQSCWQILPLGPTGYGDSPYQPFSAFAGNPYFIDLDRLVEEGLLTLEECEAVDFGEDPRKAHLRRCIRPSPTRNIMPVNGCACCGIRRCEPARVVTMTISSMLSPCWR